VQNEQRIKHLPRRNLQVSVFGVLKNYSELLKSGNDELVNSSKAGTSKVEHSVGEDKRTEC
jgi:hypothetical protein